MSKSIWKWLTLAQRIDVLERLGHNDMYAYGRPIVATALRLSAYSAYVPCQSGAYALKQSTL